FDGVAQRAVLRAQADAMSSRHEARRTQTVRLPGAGSVGGDDQCLGTETIDFDEKIIRRQAGFRRLKIAAEVFVLPRVETRDLGAVVDRRAQVRRWQRLCRGGPLPAADD